MKIIRLLLAISTLIISLNLTGLSAQPRDDRTPGEKAFEYRDGLMHAIEWKMGQLAGMATGEIEGDRDLFRDYAADLAALSGMILEGFVPNSRVEGSRAKEAIWDDWDDFTEKAQDLAQAADSLARAAAAPGFDIRSFDPREFGRNCGNCHREYKQRD